MKIIQILNKHYLKSPEVLRRILTFILLSVYFGVLLIFTGLVTGITQTTSFNFFLVVLGIVVAAVLTIFIPKIISVDFCLFEHSQRRSIFVGILMALITFIVYFIYQRGYFPGGLTPDSYLQYKMAMGDEPLTNWHPALHTLIIYKIPLMLGRHLGMIIMLQILYFSLAVGYVAYSLYRSGIHGVLIFLYGLYIWTNQYLATYMMYSWKDQALMICGLLLFGIYIRVVTSKGEWLQPCKNRIFFSLVAVMCGYMRHNAVLFVLPMVVIVIMVYCRNSGDHGVESVVDGNTSFSEDPGHLNHLNLKNTVSNEKGGDYSLHNNDNLTITENDFADGNNHDFTHCHNSKSSVCSYGNIATKRAKWLRASIIGLLVFIFISVKFLYLALNVEKPDNLVIETIGMPITVWGNVMKNCPQVLPEDTLDVMYELADAEAWETIYVQGSFEELRYSGEFHNDLADKLSYGDVLRYTWQCFTLAPEESWRALAIVTASVWSTYAEERPTDVDIWGNRYEIEPAPGLKAQEIDNQMLPLFSIAPARVFYGSIGTFLLVMLLVVCWLFPKAPGSMLHILPIFAYCFGTCPLLAGNYYRFFLITIPLWIPVCLLCIQNSKRADR